MTLRRAGWLLLLLAAGCTSSPGDSGDEDLRAARRRWVQLGISDYTFDFTRSCFCGGPVRPLRVVVHDDSVLSVIDPSTNAPPAFMPANWVGTIDDVFAELQREYDRDARILELTFDPQYHYPTRAQVDRIPAAIDDEFALQLSNFRALR